MLVMAKEPLAGRVKTRLCPPLDPTEAAAVAEAALADTLETVAACGAPRRILALDGAVGDWLPPGFTVVEQRGDSFAARLANAWSDAGGPGVQIGMDTPQVSAAILDDALGRLDTPAGAAGRAGSSGRALLGPATDGGWWAIGFDRRPNDVFAGVPMSTSATGRAQRARLEALGWSVELLDQLTDIDTVADLVAVARTIPASRTALAATEGRLGMANAAVGTVPTGTAPSRPDSAGPTLSGVAPAVGAGAGPVGSRSQGALSW